MENLSKLLCCLFLAFAFIQCHSQEKHRPFGGHGNFDPPMPNPASNPILDSICSGNSTCEKTAGKCLPKCAKPDFKKFCTCVNSTEGVLDIYNAYVRNTSNRFPDICAAGAGVTVFPFPGGFPLPGRPGRFPGMSGQFPGGFPRPPKVDLHAFFEYVENQNSTLFAEFQCCINQEEGKFFANGTANVETWKAIVETIRDPSAEAAALTVLNNCTTAATGCNATSLMLCIVQGCYTELTT